MMMRRNILFVFCLWLALGEAVAQKLTVESMTAAPMDLSASQYERKDLAGQACGLVKVQLATPGAQFEGNVIGKADYKTGEYWVYMSEGSYMLSVKHPSFIPLSVNFRDYGITGIEGKVTYKLTLLMPVVGNMDIDDGMRYLAMTVEPSNAMVYIDDNLQALQNGMLSLLLPMGQHTYRIEAPAYEPKSGSFTIGNETLQLPVKLESVMSVLSVSTTTPGTQIYVNDQLRGTSSWSGSLPAGTYRVEGRLSGHRKYRQNITLSQRDDQQLTIPALQAITGILNVNYQPLNAEVWLDGKKVGSSPNVFRNITIGSHDVELRADGYTSRKERVSIEEGKTFSLTGSLEKPVSAIAQSSTPQSSTPQSSSVSGSAVERFTVDGVLFNMVRVDGGTFQMGATSEQGSDAYDWEKPAHQVTLSSYYIGETEVTQELWQAVMGSNPSYYKGANLPVERVSWNDCQDFIRKLNAKTGRQFRLPTEAEWEYAARGGRKSQGYKYSGSNTIDDVAWYDKTTNGEGTRDVKTKQANELGLYDMSGNVYEWCEDWYGAYSSSSQSDPKGPSSGSSRVHRGGSYYFARWCRVSYRDFNSPDYSWFNLGLRLAL